MGQEIGCLLFADVGRKIRYRNGADVGGGLYGTDNLGWSVRILLNEGGGVRKAFVCPFCSFWLGSRCAKEILA